MSLSTSDERKAELEVIEIELIRLRRRLHGLMGSVAMTKSGRDQFVKVESSMGDAIDGIKGIDRRIL